MFWNIFYKLCEENNTKPNAVAKIIGVSNATCTKWKNGTIPNGETLLKLADHFNVAVDYILGRTEKPNNTLIKSGDINGNNNSLTDSNNVNINTKDEKKRPEIDGTALELLTVFNNLSFCDKAKVMSLIAELSEKNK
ncbi:MAG: helix-turn-helix transcriptional regulator [Ruminococcus sp.]|nr:helix-turn-helix transcriptional regulator [Ruminococcus sp.]